jgi:hypothetical protein
VLLDTSFSNNPKVDRQGSYQDYPKAGAMPRDGAAAADTLGYEFFGDSVYPLEFTFPHSSRELTLEFASSLFEGKGEADESWGLDNVRIVAVELDNAQGRHRLRGDGAHSVNPRQPASNRKMQAE